MQSLGRTGRGLLLVVNIVPMPTCRIVNIVIVPTPWIYINISTAVLINYTYVLKKAYLKEGFGFGLEPEVLVQLGRVFLSFLDVSQSHPLYPPLVVLSFQCN